MNPNEPQMNNPQQPVASVDKANQSAASLAFATNLQNQLLQHQSPQAPQMPQNAPSTQTQETVKEPTKEEKPQGGANLSEELTSFKKEIEGMLDSKLGDIKRELESIMAEEKDETNENTEETKTTPTA